MRKIIQLMIASGLFVGLAGCAPGPIYIGGQPTPVKDASGNVQYVTYKVHQKRMLTVPKSTGSDLISNKLNALYAQDPVTKAYPIMVSTSHGVVTLSGKVPSAAVKGYAIKAARYTKGVLAVNAKNLVISTN